ncbi:P-II family nitrogen regulator [Thiohalobacter sp. IOR34]|uniref:P-II family nitrogen regulator n=1 Tax=Thiohalobacter sp. IOR34 TaxID=3057176 RepID=UPI0025B121EC|nr:P-II family nitrogen regulator [Thiohalobacter sp. IOR34]WJW74273.1 P-II family nitrogen regulator [Thiohalobacter sp. IOR34]
MSYSKVTAIVRLDRMEAVEKSLIEAGAQGMTVTQVKGCGEWKDFFNKDWLVTHARVEVFTGAGQAEVLARAIMEAAHTGEEGDGIVAILPVTQLYRIRSKAAGMPEPG